MLLYSSDFYGNLNCKTRSKSMMHVDNNQAWSLELHGCILGCSIGEPFVKETTVLAITFCHT